MAQIQEQIAVIVSDNNQIERCTSSFFYNLLTALWSVSNTYALVAQVKSCAAHTAFITCNLQCATWYEGTAQLLSLTELKSHLF